MKNSVSCVRQCRVCRRARWRCQNEPLKRCWHPEPEKSVEICRARRINSSLLGQADGCRGEKGAGGSDMIVEKMTSERRGVNERGG